MSALPPEDRCDCRGQTSVDFLIGMAVFLLAVGFVAAVATGVVAPVADEQTPPALADRVTDEVVGSALSTTVDPSRLDGNCTRAFFGDATADAGDCTFDPGAPLAERVGVHPRHELNVTVESDPPGSGDAAVRCVTADGEVRSCADGGTRLAVGASPPAGSATVGVGTRVAHLNGSTVTVVVRAW